jgi:SAM-dependent methyltransferase
MGLDEVRKVYEQLGREDPLYAVLTRHSRRGNRWDPEEFFASGRSEIRGVMDYLAALCSNPLRERALDFGCGVGRLSQALAEEFREVVGVDISYTMVEAAQRFDRQGGRVRYLVNTEPDLRLLEDASFDFVYSSITLQHIPPEPAARYVAEFMRVLRPGGIALFQARNGPRIRPGTLRALLYRLRREHFRRFWQRLRGRLPYEMHALARPRVEEIVAAAGGRLLDVVDLDLRRPGRSYRYCVTR